MALTVGQGHLKSRSHCMHKYCQNCVPTAHYTALFYIPSYICFIPLLVELDRYYGFPLHVDTEMFVCSFVC